MIQRPHTNPAAIHLREFPFYSYFIINTENENEANSITVCRGKNHFW